MKKKVFVAHVFNPQYMDDFRRSMKNVCDKLGFEPVYADDKLVNGHILKDKIFPDMERADFCVFEISEIQKPNVFIELGFAQGKDRPSVIIMRNGIIPPSDLAGYDRVEYTSFVNLEEQLYKLLPTLKLKTATKFLEEEKFYNMVYVPETKHIIGTSEEKLQQNLRELPSYLEKYLCAEFPAHECATKGFYIDKYQVTNEQYFNFVLATDYTSPSEKFLKHLRDDNGKLQYPNKEILNHPVVSVSYYDAKAYAEWSGKRLPTEIEWELAARGIDQREYPWGNKWEKGRCNSQEMSLNNTTPVGSFELGKSIYGCYDMAGNAWDWTDSWYEPYPDGEKYINPDMGKKNKVLRGGSFVYEHFDQRCAFRAIKEPDLYFGEFSFRCAMSV